MGKVIDISKKLEQEKAERTFLSIQELCDAQIEAIKADPVPHINSVHKKNFKLRKAVDDIKHALFGHISVFREDGAAPRSTASILLERVTAAQKVISNFERDEENGTR